MIKVIRQKYLGILFSCTSRAINRKLIDEIISGSESFLEFMKTINVFDRTRVRQSLSSPMPLVLFKNYILISIYHTSEQCVSRAQISYFGGTGKCYHLRTISAWLVIEQTFTSTFRE